MWPLAVLTGALSGFGVFLAVREFVPGTPRLQAALDRLTGADRPVEVASDADARTIVQRTGVWTHRVLPAPVMRWGGPTPADLDLIGKTPTTHYGEKALSALVGLVTVPLLLTGATLLGTATSVSFPAGCGLAFAAGAWFVPDLDARAKAKRARATFSRAVSTYLELLAIERISGAGATQATFGAAQVARSWPFQRIAEALERGRWEGRPPWAALRELGSEVGIDELGDVADIMEQAGTQGSAVHDQLQARAAAMRDAQLDAEQQVAHDATVRMTIPGTLTVLVYFLMLIFPIGVSMFTTAP